VYLYTKTRFSRRVLPVLSRFGTKWGHNHKPLSKSFSLLSRSEMLDQKSAQELDVDLMSTSGFSIDQLMELAGLSVAVAIVEFLSLIKFDFKQQILIVCGPGNNGGDGMVAARHLAHFGYLPVLVYPKHSRRDLFSRLLIQCKDLKILVLDALPENLSRSYGLIVDAIFGFSYKPPLRSPFDKVLPALNKAGLPIFSVDIPSGWDVEKGNIYDVAVKPDGLISLTAPKLGVKDFRGPHFLGGRFVPPTIKEKYKLDVPKYPGTSQVLRLDKRDFKADL